MRVFHANESENSSSNMSVRRSFTSSVQNQNNDDDRQKFQHRRNRQIADNIDTSSTETSSRPLSLYDNLTALVASLKPPHLNNSNNTVLDQHQHQQQQPQQQSENNLNNNFSNNSLSSRSSSLARPNSSSGSDHLFSVNKDDFIFSDITFEFPELSPATSQSRLEQNYSLVNSVINKINNNNNDSDLNSLMNELLNDVTRNQIQKPTGSSMATESQPPPVPARVPTGITPTPQYVNIDESFLKKPAISDAKSSFFGLNGVGNDENDSSLSPLLEQHRDKPGILQSPPPPSSINNYRRLMMNDDVNLNESRTNNNNNMMTNGDGTPSAAATVAYDKLRVRTDSPHKSVTYGPSTEGYNEFESKPSQVN